jgi:hypothetical protein
MTIVLECIVPVPSLVALLNPLRPVNPLRASASTVTSGPPRRADTGEDKSEDGAVVGDSVMPGIPLGALLPLLAPLPLPPSLAC